MTGAFAAYLNIHVQAESTRRAYLKDLRRLLPQLPPEEEWGSGALMRALLALSHGISPGAHRRRIAALRHYCRFRGLTDALQQLDLELVRRPGAAGAAVEYARRRARRGARILTREEMERLLAAAGREGGFPERDRLIVLLMLLGGLKPGEITQLKVADLALDVPCLRVRGREVRVLPLSPAVAALFAAHLQKIGAGSASQPSAGGSAGAPGSTDGGGRDDACAAEAPLFPGASGRPLSAAGVDWILRRVLAHAGLAGISSRDLRATAAHLMQMQGADLAAIQRFLGLRSESAAARYLASTGIRVINPFAVAQGKAEARQALTDGAGVPDREGAGGGSTFPENPVPGFGQSRESRRS